MVNTICKFGSGKQDMATCKMIYLHIKGYYTEESYKEALKLLCPNLKEVDNGRENLEGH